MGLEKINTACVPPSKEVGIGSSVISFHLARVRKGGKSKAGTNSEVLGPAASLGDEEQALELSQISGSCGIQVQGASSSFPLLPQSPEGGREL